MGPTPKESDTTLAKGGAATHSNQPGKEVDPRLHENMEKKENNKQSFNAKMAAIIRNDNYSVSTKIELIRDLIASDKLDDELAAQMEKLPAANQVFLALKDCL